MHHYQNGVVPKVRVAISTLCPEEADLDFNDDLFLLDFLLGSVANYIMSCNNRNVGRYSVQYCIFQLLDCFKRK